MAGLPDVYAQPITPRFFEIDSQGVMFNMWYLGHVDDAMTGYFAAKGIPYTTWGEFGIDVQVVHTELDWKTALRFEDTPEILIAASRLGRTSLTLEFAFRRADEIVCTGAIVYVVVAADGSGATPLPASFAEALLPLVPLRDHLLHDLPT
jgi:acyl-CoA thioester hydrolase